MKFPLESIRSDTPEEAAAQLAENAVLYIEDNQLNYELMEAVVDMIKLEEHEPCSIDRAKTGNEGIKMLLEKRYNCIVLDLGLPDMHGKECFKQIKNNPDTKHIPVMIYTASMDREMHKCLSAIGDVYCYLHKPGDIQLIKQKILAAFKS